MPTKKQRRRREKGKRHEYEYVMVDEEGNEVSVDPGDLRKEKEKERVASPRSASKGRTPPAARDRKGRPIRPVQPPSWNRAVKRAIPFAGLMLAFLVWQGSRSNQGGGLIGAVAIGAIYTVAFVPMMYFIDRAAYRRYLRVSGREDELKSS